VVYRLGRQFTGYRETWSIQLDGTGNVQLDPSSGRIEHWFGFDDDEDELFCRGSSTYGYGLGRRRIDGSNTVTQITSSSAMRTFLNPNDHDQAEPGHRLRWHFLALASRFLGTARAAAIRRGLFLHLRIRFVRQYHGGASDLGLEEAPQSPLEPGGEPAELLGDHPIDRDQHNQLRVPIGCRRLW